MGVATLGGGGSLHSCVGEDVHVYYFSNILFRL